MRSMRTLTLIHSLNPLFNLLQPLLHFNQQHYYRLSISSSLGGMAANVLKYGAGISARAVFSPSLRHLLPFDIITCSSKLNTSLPISRIRRRRSAVCLCTTTEIVATSEAEEELKKLKEAADMLDIRVGVILRAWRHEEADSLYVEEVDIGEAEPRIICSGLVNYIPINNLHERKVVVLANLKPRNMRGVKSCGMLMAASDGAHEKVELLEPPEGSLLGQRIWFGSEDDHQNQPPPATPNQIQKKKIWEMVQPHLKTDETCRAVFGL